GFGGNHGGQSSSDKSLSGNEGDMRLQSVYDLCISLCTQVTDQAKEIKYLKAQIKKLKKKAKPIITHHKAWMKSVSMKQRLAGKKSLKKQWMQIESKEMKEKEVSTEDALSTDKEKDSTDIPDKGIDKKKVSTDKEKDSTDRLDEGTVDQTEGRSATPTTPTPTPTTFRDDETIAQVLLNTSQAKAVSREKEKGVELKDKCKKKIEEDESDTESEDIKETEKKFKMLAHDEEIARKMQEDCETEEERKRLAEEEATNVALIQDFDDIKARMEVDRLLALRLQEGEREQFIVEEREKFLHDTITAQRRFLAEQRAIVIRNRPPTRTQLRNQMMTYLKNVGNKKHSDLKNKTFEEIQALYEKVKRFDESFTAVGSTKDERKIKGMNEGAKDLEQKRLMKKVAKETPNKGDTAKVPAKVDVTEQDTKKRKGGHMKMLARKRKRPQSDVDSDDEHKKCLKIVSSPDGDYLVIYRANGNFKAFNYLLEVLYIFDRQDLFHLYDLVMNQYSEVTMEGIKLILWGDLKILMESSKEENDQKIEDGTIIYMLVERRYPLSKDLMQRMLDFGLEVEIERHFARERRTNGNQDNRRRDAWNSGNKDGRRSGKQEDFKALVTIDGECVDWTSHSEEEDYALMACNSSGSNTEATSCSKQCKESYAELKKLYDEQRAQLSDASREILAYTQALKKVEAQLVAHQKGQLWYEEKIRFMKIDLDDKTDVLTYHKKLLAEAEKEKEDFKAKVEKLHNSSKNLGKLLNTQMSANDKFGLGYGDYRYDGILSYENEVLQSVFMNKECNLENQPLYDRFVTAEGMHAAPPPMTGNYMPYGPDIKIDYSQFTYGPKQSQTSESEIQTSNFVTCESNCSDETHESLPEPAINEPKVVSQPKDWETVKNQFKHSKNPKVDKKGLGYGFTTKACFVCGSLSHLIRDCDFHKKRMAKQAELNNRMRKKSSQREIKSVWNNVQRMNHQNRLVPKAVLTRTGKIPVNIARTSSTNTVNTARHNFNRQAVPINVARRVKTVKLIVNNTRPKAGFHKSVSPFRKSLNRTTALRTIFLYQNVNTAKDYPHRALKNKGIVDSGCSRHMTGNKAYLAEY
ncbi:hypothetical protein Tco_1119181, partial [Tanacetum coccineum]